MNASQKLSQIFVVLSLLLLAAACGDTSSPGTDSSIADSGSADQTVSDSGAPDSSTPDGTKTDVLVHYSFGNQIEGSELTRAGLMLGSTPLGAAPRLSSTSFE